MEAVEETLGASDHFLVNKGRRTKRPRPSSPFSLASSSNIGGEDGSSSSADMSTIEFIKNTDDEEDMANCLIFLAQGQNNRNEQKRNWRKNVETGEGLYECKTCTRSFTSFQALGGHRASHKKPKATINEEKKDLQERQFESNNTNFGDHPLVHRADHHHIIGNNNNKSKVHECSICGSEFSSGQALGGHMRRHRNMTTASMAMNNGCANDQKPRNVFGFDLNLPAPEEDVVFAPKQQPLIFSAPALVDCHY